MSKLFSLGHESGARELPIMSLREVVMFPKSIVPLFVGREASIKAIEHALSKYDKKIFLVTQNMPEKERPEADDLFEMGTVSKILQLLRLPDGTIKVLFEGLGRAHWDKSSYRFDADAGYPLVEVAPLDESDSETSEDKALVRAMHEGMEKYAKINKKLAQETVVAISSITQAGRLADAVMPHLKTDFITKQRILEELDPTKRLEEAYGLLSAEKRTSRWIRIKDPPTFLGTARKCGANFPSGFSIAAMNASAGSRTSLS